MATLPPLYCSRPLACPPKGVAGRLLTLNRVQSIPLESLFLIPVRCPTKWHLKLYYHVSWPLASPSSSGYRGGLGKYSNEASVFKEFQL